MSMKTIPDDNISIMSSNVNMNDSKDKIKQLGQVFTPKPIVNKMLNDCNYVNSNNDIIHMRILEPSFGTGVFIYEIINKLITCFQDNGYSKHEIETIVNDNIHGVEYDEELYIKTKHDLQEYCSHHFNESYDICFSNLINADTLDYNNDKKLSFDLIIGNPPYVKIQNLTDAQRVKLSMMSLTGGNTDLYIAFYELCMQWLHDDESILCFISPSGWMRGSSQEGFRKQLALKRLLSSVYDYSNVNVFNDASTYTEITVISRNHSKTGFTYHHMTSIDDCDYKTTAHYADFIDGKSLQYLCLSENDNIRMQTWTSDVRDSIGSHYEVCNGLATLSDKIYINDGFDLNDTYVRRIVKASKFTGLESDYSKIIFPYDYDVNKGVFTPADEEELSSNHADIYNHLTINKNTLVKRSIDLTKYPWFAYGRTQGLQADLKRKLVFNPVVSPGIKHINAYIIDKHVMVYSGLFITESDDDYTLERLQDTIQSEDFHDYCMLTGASMSGGYRRIGSKEIRRFNLK